ncbi:MAG: ribulose-phosphate 3-epimerase [Bacteroidales bacterium]|jgi:ribulose-phosphate 3-epimerase|nr:ribulose-phosphate 3-epimerase [Bacteroidales bacterium]
MNKIAVSILNCDFGELSREIEMVNSSVAEWFHLDIMDGVFVPNISFGFPVVQAVKKKAAKPLDVHLMITAADRYIRDFKEAGADWLTVHYEACPHLHRTVQNIKQEGMKAGVSLNPHTPVSVLEDIVGDVDMVLLMSVNPGFGGQAFIENTYDKTMRLKEMITRKGAHALIQVDGGVDIKNIAQLAEAGVDVFVVGSFIFRAENPVQTIRELTNKQ